MECSIWVLISSHLKSKHAHSSVQLFSSTLFVNFLPILYSCILENYCYINIGNSWNINNLIFFCSGNYLISSNENFLQFFWMKISYEISNDIPNVFSPNLYPPKLLGINIIMKSVMKNTIYFNVTTSNYIIYAKHFWLGTNEIF